MEHPVDHISMTTNFLFIVTYKMTNKLFVCTGLMCKKLKGKKWIERGTLLANKHTHLSDSEVFVVEVFETIKVIMWFYHENILNGIRLSSRSFK